MSVAVGIDALNIYASTLSVDCRAVARARGLSDKEFRNVRFERRSVLPPYEDPVTLAVNAAKPLLGHDAGGRYQLLIVATETGLDYGKPLSTYVQSQLGLGPNCRNFEVKHACFAGTAALQTAVSFVRTSPGARALVVMTDVARCHVGDQAETSAGAGAVALTVAEAPRLLEIEPESGRASQEVFDVARPTPTRELNDAVLSLYAYLDLLEGAWADYRAAVGPVALEQHFAYMLYHAPLVSLVERAHRLALESDGSEVEPAVAAASFEQMVLPSLRYNFELANLYSGSLYASLAGLLEHAPVAHGDRVGLFSYGSGACAELFAGRVGPAARATVAAQGIGDRLRRRRELSVPAYEALVRAFDGALALESFAPDFGAVPGHFESHYEGRGLLVLDGVKNYRRSYRWA